MTLTRLNYGIRADRKGQVYFQRSAVGYCSYVRDMNDWAANGGFAPDQLEMFLFNPPVHFYTSDVNRQRAS